MNDNVFQFILKSQKIEYVEFDHSFRSTQVSPGLISFISPERMIKSGEFITDIFYELLGYEQYLVEIRDGKKPPLYLNWINRTPLSISPAHVEGNPSLTYFNLQVFPFQSGVLVILRDISQESHIEQIVYNRHNELDLLSRQLIEDLKLANAELNLAYQTTLEGWARALEMRDVETKGHSDRVVKLTRLLASSMGIDDSDIALYCYGALLHDIGKMGIPDQILLKPGHLDDSEWVIMKRHPIYAKELLMPIKYLEKALSIPFYHHEKWNGNGYPIGLKGEEIDLPARIFTVIDVYDALTSVRPYRLAWSHQDALKYIEERSGIDFDPQVVKSFLALFP